jgi:nucleoside recognition membrane protein YjiH
MLQYRSPHKRVSYFWHSILLVFIVGAVILNVWHINYQAQYSFTTRELEDKKAALTDSVRALDYQVSSNRSLARVVKRTEPLALVAPKDVVFLKVGLSTVAAAVVESESAR